MKNRILFIYIKIKNNMLILRPGRMEKSGIFS